MSLSSGQGCGRPQDRGHWAGRALRTAPQEEPSPGNSEQFRQTTGPPGFLPCPHRLPCQRQRVCETLSGGQWELEGPRGSLSVVTIFLRSPREGGFRKTAIHTVIGSSCCGRQAPDGGPTISGPRPPDLRAPPCRPTFPGPPQMQGLPGCSYRVGSVVEGLWSER